jgi:hypothetical protein
VLKIEQNHSSYWKKTNVIIAHLCSETEFFGGLNTFRFKRLIRYSGRVQPIQFYLRNRTKAHRTGLMGCTVKKLVKFWVCKLSFLNRILVISVLALIFYRWGPARTMGWYLNISLGRRDGTVRAQTVFSLLRLFNTGYCVKYPFFARILTPSRAQASVIY